MFNRTCHDDSPSHPPWYSVLQQCRLNKQSLGSNHRAEGPMGRAGPGPKGPGPGPLGPGPWAQTLGPGPALCGHVWTHFLIGVRGFPARGYFIPGRDGAGAQWLGKVTCRRRATGSGCGGWGCGRGGDARSDTCDIAYNISIYVIHVPHIYRERERDFAHNVPSNPASADRSEG